MNSGISPTSRSFRRHTRLMRDMVSKDTRFVGIGRKFATLYVMRFYFNQELLLINMLTFI